MPWKWNPFTKNLDYYQRASSSRQVVPLNVVFYESFTGDGHSVSYTINGTIQNAIFSSGSWNISNVQVTYQSHVTKDNSKALYDSLIPIIRNRIQISSINTTTGEVILSYPPRNNEIFRIWYWYSLASNDSLTNYRREDFVASMEEDDTLAVSDHLALDQLVHDLDENYYEEVTYSGWRISAIIIWTSYEKIIKIREYVYTWTGILVTGVEEKQYNSFGILVETLTYTFTYASNYITSITCIRS